MKQLISAILVAALLNACQTTKYVADSGDYRLGKPYDTEKVVRKVRREIGENYFLFGTIPAIDQRDINDVMDLEKGEALANMQIENKITGIDGLIMIGVCLVTACISSIVWTKRTTIISGDIVTDAPAH